MVERLAHRGHTTVITAIVFGLSVTALVMILLLLSYRDSFAREAASASVLPPEISGEHTITVTATVEEALGTKLLRNDFGRIVYLVYGNFRRGFSVISNENNEGVYEFSGMPGDGVQVDLDNEYQYKIVPKY